MDQFTFYTCKCNFSLSISPSLGLRFFLNFINLLPMLSIQFQSGDEIHQWLHRWQVEFEVPRERVVDWDRCRAQVYDCRRFKIRILDGMEVVKKTREIRKSDVGFIYFHEAKLSSVGGDSRLPLRTIVAIPWSGLQADHTDSLSVCACKTKYDNCVNASTASRESERFSFSDWFSMNSSSRRFATWPEEKLPSFELPYESDQIYSNDSYCSLHQHHKDNCETSSAWAFGVAM
ncbi:hypothetical protein Leryth_015679 [Lithospermum erythrorhizon]|nr:hypothetical protein Leryth_015679 [Lithospermum erythrorhizon]